MVKISTPISTISFIVVATSSFFTYFPDSLNMGIKINWRGEFKGDDDHVAKLFIERNEDLVERQRKKLRRLKITDTYVNSRKILFKKILQSRRDC